MSQNGVVHNWAKSCRDMKESIKYNHIHDHEYDCISNNEYTFGLIFRDNINTLYTTPNKRNIQILPSPRTLIHLVVITPELGCEIRKQCVTLYGVQLA